ncbi:transcriptional regulator [Nguyenibacter vanlangensis]|uniref:Transcriptional regulator n=1 Tax=Nguyenibacter vanlangensis TaxID=1216886 RepID=A0ABZ3D4K5_9PROT
MTADLGQAGIRAVHNDHKAEVDVAAIRKKLKLSRRQFALWYGLEEETIKGWESGERTPDTAARSYLRAIANRPDAVRDAYREAG